MPLHHIIYLSTPTRAFTAQQLNDLLVECRAGNARRELTGILFAGPGHFLQLLEGEETDVAGLYEQLQQDPRHHSLLKVADKPITQRAFAEWSMAFQTLDPLHPGEGFQPLESIVTDIPALAAADILLLETVRKQLLTTPVESSTRSASV